MSSKSNVEVAKLPRKPAAKKEAPTAVVSFRLPKEDYDKLLRQAAKKRQTVSEAAKANYQGGQTLRHLIQGIQGQADAIDGLRDEMSRQVDEAEARLSQRIDSKLHAMLRDEFMVKAIRAGIESGVSSGIDRVMAKLYEEGEAPSRRALGAEGAPASRQS